MVKADKLFIAIKTCQKGGASPGLGSSKGCLYVAPCHRWKECYVKNGVPDRMAIASLVEFIKIDLRNLLKQEVSLACVLAVSVGVVAHTLARQLLLTIDPFIIDPATVIMQSDTLWLATLCKLGNQLNTILVKA